jgi:hypothetical protein
MIRILSVLLLIQLAVAAWLLMPDDRGPVGRAALLDALSREQLTALTIRDGEGDSVTLTRTTDGWQLPASLPIDSSKLDTLLDALLASDPGFAIARSESAAKRFEVAPETFERAVELRTDSAAHTVYLGSSPSFRKIHVRRDGEAEIFVVQLNNYDAPASASEWLDKTLLALPNPTELEIDGLRLALGGERWLDDSGAEVDGETVTSLLTALSSLRVSGVADEDEAAAAQPLLRVDGDDSGRKLALTLLHDEAEDRYYLRSDLYDTLFSASAYDAERLRDAAAALTAPEVIDEEADSALAGDETSKTEGREEEE